MIDIPARMHDLFDAKIDMKNEIHAESDVQHGKRHGQKVEVTDERCSDCSSAYETNEQTDDRNP